MHRSTDKSSLIYGSALTPLHERRSRKPGPRNLCLHALERSAVAEYMVPPTRDRLVASFSTRSTPTSLKSSQSFVKRTGYGPHGFGLDRSYSTIRKRSVKDKSLFRNRCCSRMKCREFAKRIPSTVGRRRLELRKSPRTLRIWTPSYRSGISSNAFWSRSTA